MRPCGKVRVWIDAGMISRYLFPLLAIPVLASAQPVALFDGKSLTGWSFDVIDPQVKPADVWSVKDGMIVCKGRPPAVLRTEKDYSDYELTIEWRWAPGGKPGNSGLLVHASKPREMFVWPKSLEVQLGSGNAGDFWMIGESVRVRDTTPQGRRWIKRQSSAEKPAGEWNTMTVRCEGDTIRVTVNGILMNEGYALSATKGAICLQSEGAEVHFRKVQLTPLAAAQADSPVPAEKSR